MCHWHMGKEDVAREWYIKGTEWAEQDVPKDEELPRVRREAAQLLGISDRETED